MGEKTGRPRGRPPKNGHSIKDLAARANAPMPGGKEAGERGLAEIAGYLEAELPYKTRAKLLVQLTSQVEGVDKGVPQSCLAALKYVNDLCGLVTRAQEKEAESLAELPQILIASDAPPPKAGSVEALKLLSAAKGSQYDEAFPSSPPPEPEPPKPYRSEVSVTVSEPQAS